MNKCKAAYCRIFQKCFKIAIPFFALQTSGSFLQHFQTDRAFAEKGIDTVLIITDAGIRKFGLLDRMLMHFDHHNIHYFIYDKTVANPTTTNVEEARELYLEKHCDAIIGFGGGSSIDCAKAVGARIAKPKQSLSKMKGILKVHKNCLYWLRFRQLQEPEAKPLSLLLSQMPGQDTNMPSMISL